VARRATVEAGERHRLFLALELPSEVVEQLVAWSERHLVRGRPVSSFHVTLAFLGGQPRTALEAITDILCEESLATGPIRLELVRYRETRSVGMLVLADPSGEATGLARRLHARLEARALYRPESRPWLPHVTVLRFRERPRLAAPVPEIEPFAPSGAAAFLSHLRPTGAWYEVLESCSLGG
jgi:2'-5' RNA ligase